MDDKKLLNKIISDFEYLKEEEDLGDVINKWAEYSDNKIGFPSDIQGVIDTINLYKGLELEAPYGYQILYFAISNGWEIDFTIDYFKVDRFGYKVLYPFK